MNQLTPLETGNAAGTSPARDAVKYSFIGTELLSSGVTTIPKGSAENMWVHSKVYAGGGENALHAHAEEDHTFFVLQGAAEFEFAGGRKELAGKFEGVLIPKGVLYKFQAQGDENLVMIRVGSAQRGEDWTGESRLGMPVELFQSVGADGKRIVDNASLAKGTGPGAPVIPIPGRFFGQD